ncbi:MAG: chitobiase/beta-hexosaminidase C-terminal domain-containing protein, partial [Ignavibacteriales bacterium]|nr:chitobiase/beta-hexosaminidase C-terminal domain-containing protein [Ignavibacteriales bacterium]
NTDSRDGVAIYWTVSTNEQPEPSDPTTSSTPYTAPIMIYTWPTEVVIKAAAFKTGFNHSTVTRKVYRVIDGILARQKDSQGQIFGNANIFGTENWEPIQNRLLLTKGLSYNFKVQQEFKA